LWPLNGFPRKTRKNITHILTLHSIDHDSIIISRILAAVTIMDAPPPDQNNHGHKTRKEGRGAKEAKKDKKAKVAGTRVEKHNNRAFSVANIVRTQRTLQRNSDRKHKKEYVPQKDRRAAKDSNEAPPSLVVVMGPPGVGKVSLPL
jgi:hypothetical protein